jgi:transposase-like protein
MESPKTLQEAIVFFSNPDNCIAYMVMQRWPDGVVVCPNCGRKDVSWLAKQRKWQCKSKHVKRQFSAKVGTIFEDSPLPLDKWLMAAWMITNCKNGVSSYEIARAVNVTQKSAWFMLQRLRLAMQDDKGGKLGGEIEMDETFIGGKVQNMHRSKRPRGLGRSHGIQGKTIVVGMLERQGRVKTAIVCERTQKMLHGLANANIAPGSTLITDEWGPYKGNQFVHEIINHADAYVRGHVHTNGIENFWSLLKRSLSGTYVSVEPFHLFRYLDEQMFRYNNRRDKTDKDRFALALSQIAGKRLTYAEVTGKVPETAI